MNAHFDYNKKLALRMAVTTGLVFMLGATTVHSEVYTKAGVTIYTAPAQGVQPSRGEYASAVPRKLPVIDSAIMSAAKQKLKENMTTGKSGASMGVPKVEAGFEGDGGTTPVYLGLPDPSAQATELLTKAPQQYGYFQHPFTTARADLSSLNSSTNNNVATNTRYPYRATGKLYFGQDGIQYMCSASLIKKGIVITAAHCVSEFGQNFKFNTFQFIPAFRKDIAPYGVWEAAAVYVNTSYLNGTSVCHPDAPGVVCDNDVALIKLKPKTSSKYPNGYYAGTVAGTYGYALNGWGFTDLLGLQLVNASQVTQLGYPYCLDEGKLMERTDSLGYMAPDLINNTVIGSWMCGGSSGGPWLNNFGIRPTLVSGEQVPGSDSTSNVVMGVTSWGYVGEPGDPLLEEQGASPLTTKNMVGLINAACGKPVTDPACK